MMTEGNTSILLRLKPIKSSVYFEIFQATIGGRFPRHSFRYPSMQIRAAKPAPLFLASVLNMICTSNKIGANE